MRLTGAIRENDKATASKFLVRRLLMATSQQRGLADGVNGITDSQRGLPPLPPLMQDKSGVLAASFYFGKGDSVMDPQNTRACDQLQKKIATLPRVSIKIDGHASSEGDATANRDLSENRRRAVRALLLQEPVHDAEVTGEAYGESKPSVSEGASNYVDVERARRVNRRVDVVIIPIVTNANVVPARPPTQNQVLDQAIVRKPPPPATRPTADAIVRTNLSAAWEATVAKLPLVDRLPPEIRRQMKDKAIDYVIDGAWDLLRKQLQEYGGTKAEVDAVVSAAQALAKRPL
jgi:outer membrane protein OmpA-like peptidoglycan-associated protein